MKDYIGVRYNSLFKNYESKVTDGGIVYSCGHYDTPREAALARDKCILKKGLKKPLQILKSTRNE